MTITPSIYALPRYAAPSSTPSTNVKKRKRVAGSERADKVVDSDSDLATSQNSPSNAIEVEYSAVLTPAQRAQYRLAGHSYDENVAPYPFPHRDNSQVWILSTRDDGNPSFAADFRPLKSPSTDSESLRTQHLATVMAVLQRSMMDKDFKRASRALSLILRHNVRGEAVDLRQAGLWGIAAELLLYDHGNQDMITRTAFELVKKYYTIMATSFPPHKTWKEAVNAHDFYTAMFGLWVFVTCEESQRARKDYLSAESEYDSDHQAAGAHNAWTLEQARAIGKQMDEVMSRVPFMDNLELIRLRAMVASWTADLILHSTDEVDASTDRHGQEQTLQSAEVVSARALAAKLFAKLKGASRDEAEDGDESVWSG